MAKDCRSLHVLISREFRHAGGDASHRSEVPDDANGILHVSAREQRSGKEAEIELQPSYGLTDEQVESMILEVSTLPKRTSGTSAD